jgi:hypothetical protein
MNDKLNTTWTNWDYNTTLDEDEEFMKNANVTVNGSYDSSEKAESDDSVVSSNNSVESDKYCEVDVLYEKLYRLHKEDDRFITWIKNGNVFIGVDYFKDDESDENWLYALSNNCVSDGVEIAYVNRVFLISVEEKVSNPSDDEWDQDIDINEKIQPFSGGRWLRSSRRK